MNKGLLNTIIILLVAFGLLQFASCKKDDEAEVVPAKFMVDSTDNNNPIFISLAEPKDPNLTIYYSWSFGNGKFDDDSTVTTSYDFPGYYNVSFNVSTSEGAYHTNDTMLYYVSKINKDITENPYIRNLSITNETTNYKSWVLSNKFGHIASGPSAGIEDSIGLDFLNDPIIIDSATLFPENHLVNVTLDEQAYSNRMTFELNTKMKYELKNGYLYSNSGPTNSWIVNWSFANSEFGYNQAEGEDICINVASNSTQLDTAGYYGLDEEDDGTVFLAFSGKNFMLYYEGKPSKTKYQVLALYNDLMVVRKPRYNAEGIAIGYRYLKYVPEGQTILPDKELSVIDPPTGL